MWRHSLQRKGGRASGKPEAYRYVLRHSRGRVSVPAQSNR